MPVQDGFSALDDLHFHLIVFGGAAGHGTVASLGDRVRVHAARAPAGFAQPSFHLVRPDGHIGLCGTVPDEHAIRDYLRDRPHLADPTQGSPSQ